MYLLILTIICSHWLYFHHSFSLYYFYHFQKKLSVILLYKLFVIQPHFIMSLSMLFYSPYKHCITDGEQTSFQLFSL